MSLIPNKTIKDANGNNTIVATGIYYAIQRHDDPDGGEKILDGWGNGDVKMASFSSDHPHRSFLLRPTDFDGYYAIQRKMSPDGGSKVLDGWGNGKVSMEGFQSGHKHRVWRLQPTNFGSPYYAIQRGNSNDGGEKTLDGWGNDRVSVENYDPAHKHRSFKFVPLYYTLSCEVTDFTYEVAPDQLIQQLGTKHPGTINSQIINNATDTLVTSESSTQETETYSQSWTMEKTLGFTQTIGLKVTTKFNVKSPFIQGGVDLEASVSAEFNQNFSWTETNTSEKTRTVNASRTYTIQPHSNITIVETTLQSQALSKFTVKAVYTGVGTRMKEDGTVVENSPLGKDAVRSILCHLGYTDVLTDATDGSESVFATLSGNYNVNYSGISIDIKNTPTPSS